VIRSALVGLAVTCSLAGIADAQSASEPAAGIPWLEFEEGLRVAAEREKPVLVDIFAPWCGWCTKLQTDVYTDGRIQHYLREHFAVARLNIDSVDDAVDFRGYRVTSAELAMGLGASGTPTTVFLDSAGNYITRLPGFVGADEFLQVLRFIGTEAYKSQSFENFLNSN
jgi:thioredoxin-related protein